MEASQPPLIFVADFRSLDLSAFTGDLNEFVSFNFIGLLHSKESIKLLFTSRLAFLSLFTRQLGHIFLRFKFHHLLSVKFGFILYSLGLLSEGQVDNVRHLNVLEQLFVLFAAGD